MKSKFIEAIKDYSSKMLDDKEFMPLLFRYGVRQHDEELITLLTSKPSSQVKLVFKKEFDLVFVGSNFSDAKHLKVFQAIVPYFPNSSKQKVIGFNDLGDSTKEIRKLLTSKSVTVGKNLSTVQDSEGYEEKGWCDFGKAIFSVDQEKSIKFFKSSMTNFMLKADQPNQKVILKFLNHYLGAVHPFLDQTAREKLDQDINNIFRIADSVHKAKEENLQKLNLSKFYIYEHLSSVYVLKNYLLAIKYGEMAKEIAIACNYDLANTYYNLGSAYLYINHTKAFECLNRAYDLFGSNEDKIDVVTLRTRMHLQKQNDKEARKEYDVLKKLGASDSELSNFAVYLGDDSVLERYLKTTPDELVSLRRMALIAYNQKRYQQSVEYLSKALDVLMKESNDTDYQMCVAFILQIFHDTKDYENAAEFIKSKLPGSFLAQDNLLYQIQYYVSLFSEEASDYALSDQYLEKMTLSAKETPDSASLLSRLYHVKILSALLNKDLDRAEALLKKMSGNNVLKEPVESIADYLAFLKEHQLEVLESPREKEASSSSATESQEKPNSADHEAEADQDTDEEGQIWLDPKEIHRYFQEKKKALLEMKYNEVECRVKAKWVVKGTQYSDSVDPIVHVSNFVSDTYFLISPSLKLDQQLLGFYNTALAKGFVSKAYRSMGVKLIPGKCYELKTNQLADRLYSDTIYQNSKGQKLVIFDKIAHNHSSIISSQKMEIMNVLSEIEGAVGLSLPDDGDSVNDGGMLVQLGGESYADNT